MNQYYQIPKFIAEVSSNHNNDLARCLEFVHIASELNCDAIKFQLFTIDKLFAPEALIAKPELLKRKTWELNPAFIPIIARECQKRNIAFCCTPFDVDTVHYLEPYVDWYKIASYNLLDWRLIGACAKTRKPLTISTGMGSAYEIADAINIAENNDATNISILHCVSKYPTTVQDCKLSIIPALRRWYPNYQIGWSDHSVDSAIIYRAVYRYNAQVIEFHLDLDGQGNEYSMGHCWLPEQIRPVIENCQLAIEIDGSGLSETFNRVEDIECMWRADPSDGLRPLLDLRKEL